jgi:RNA polymerase primary sigma factor
MSGQADFLEAVHELERIAKTNSNHLAMDEIRRYFSDMHLEDAQMDYICRYLESNNIIIENRVERSWDDVEEEELETKEDLLDQEMVEIYVKETEKASRLTKDQEEMIVRKMIAGDVQARNLLIESNLAYAMELATQYNGRGLLPSDLIQEANIGLMTAVNEYEPELHGTFGDFKEKLVRRHIEDAITEYSQSTRSAKKMANRVNELNDIATAFAREYEREAKPSELAQRMGISEEEVRELMKVSLDAIAVLDQGKMS